jgi:5'-nucleotidase
LNILITNDDGITSKGLKALAQTLSEVADIYVFAPNKQRSGSGHGITITRSVTMEPIDMACVKRACSVDGTPADCVKMGLETLGCEGIVIDKVFSGINNGGNLGTDTLYSGTVSAALEGAVGGLPAVAVSINGIKPLQYDTATRFARKAATMDLTDMGACSVLNINVPDLPDAEIKGVKVVPLGTREYYDWNIKTVAEDGRVFCSYGGRPVRYKDVDADTNDVGALQENYVAITPLHLDLTNHAVLGTLRGGALMEVLHADFA